MNCTVCGKGLNLRKNVSGLCRQHALSLALLPENKLSRIEGTRRFKLEHPELVREQCTRASRSRMAWCPVEYRDEYRRLTRIKQLPAAEAKRVILELVDRHAALYRRTGQLQQAA